MRKRWLVASAVASTSLILAACGDDVGGTSEVGGDVRTIEISALDELAFDPASVEVAVGETVRFVVTNEGSAEHEFIVGNAELQMEHEGQMAGGHDGADSGYPALTLEPGQTMEATVTFDEPGQLLYGCHVPGHFDGGMVGTITISA